MGGSSTCNATLSPPEGFCMKVGSSENGCNVSLIVRDSHKTVAHRPHLLERGGEPKRAFCNGNAKKLIPLIFTLETLCFDLSLYRTTVARQ